MSELAMTLEQQDQIDAIYGEVEEMICSLVGEERWESGEVDQATIRGEIIDLIQQFYYPTEAQAYEFYPWLIETECPWCGGETFECSPQVFGKEDTDPRYRFCPQHGHYDAVTVWETYQCPACNGSGKVDPNAVLGGRAAGWGVCPICKGKKLILPYPKEEVGSLS